MGYGPEGGFQTRKESGSNVLTLARSGLAQEQVFEALGAEVAFLRKLAWVFGLDDFAMANHEAEQSSVDLAATSRPDGTIPPEVIEHNPLVYWITTGEDP